MADDIVERLRFLVDDGWYPATHTEAADEIERLRAEVERQRVKAERADELQALINEYARTYPDEVSIIERRDAIAALLDAATKEDDRG